MFLKHEAPKNLTHLVSQLRDNPEHLAPMGVALPPPNPPSCSPPRGSGGGQKHFSSAKAITAPPIAVKRFRACPRAVKRPSLFHDA